MSEQLPISAPTLADLRKMAADLSDQIDAMTPPGLRKLVDGASDRPAAIALGAFGIGVMAGWLMRFGASR
jgi:hypothetical protein